VIYSGLKSLRRQQIGRVNPNPFWMIEPFHMVNRKYAFSTTQDIADKTGLPCLMHANFHAQLAHYSEIIALSDRYAQKKLCVIIALEELALLISKHSDITDDIKFRAQRTPLLKLLRELIVKSLLALKQLRHT